MDMNEESRSTKNMHTGSDRWSYHQQISSLQRLQKSHVEPSQKKRLKSPVLCFRQPSKYTNTSINSTTNRRNLNHKQNQQKEQRPKIHNGHRKQNKNRDGCRNMIRIKYPTSFDG